MPVILRGPVWAVVLGLPVGGMSHGQVVMISVLNTVVVAVAETMAVTVALAVAKAVPVTMA